VDIAVALDPATSELYEAGSYELEHEGRTLSSADMAAYWADMAERYPIVSIEDGMDEEDWEGWKELTDRIGGHVQLVGDAHVRTNQRQVFAIAVQLKVGVQRQTGLGPVFARRVDHEESPRSQGHLRKSPLAWITGFIGQMPPGQVHWRQAGILQFNPVRLIPVLVEQTTAVCHELGNQDGVRRRCVETNNRHDAEEQADGFHGLAAAIAYCQFSIAN